MSCDSNPFNQKFNRTDAFLLAGFTPDLQVFRWAGGVARCGMSGDEDPSGAACATALNPLRIGNPVEGAK